MQNEVDRLEEFKTIYKQECGIDLTRNEARIVLDRMLKFYRRVAEFSSRVVRPSQPSAEAVQLQLFEL